MRLYPRLDCEDDYSTIGIPWSLIDNKGEWKDWRGRRGFWHVRNWTCCHIRRQRHDTRVRHHAHRTGNYRWAAHDICNTYPTKHPTSTCAWIHRLIITWILCDSVNGTLRCGYPCGSIYWSPYGDYVKPWVAQCVIIPVWTLYGSMYRYGHCQKYD